MKWITRERPKYDALYAGCADTPLKKVIRLLRPR